MVTPMKLDNGVPPEVEHAALRLIGKYEAGHFRGEFSWGILADGSGRCCPVGPLYMAVKQWGKEWHVCSYRRFKRLYGGVA